MLGQLVDLLVKQDDERKRLTFFFLKLLFTGTIAAKIYISFYGKFEILSFSDYKSIIHFFLNGRFIICFGIFYFVWLLSYNALLIILSWLTLWMTAKLHEALGLFVRTGRFEIQQELFKGEKSHKGVRLLGFLYNSTDIIEFENYGIKPGKNYFKFYDYLLDIESGKKEVDSGQFQSTMALIMQFILIYNWFHLKFLSINYWFLFFSFLLMILLFTSSYIAYVLGVFVDIKHQRILNFMRHLTPDYKKQQVQQDQK